MKRGSVLKRVSVLVFSDFRKYLCPNLRICGRIPLTPKWGGSVLEFPARIRHRVSHKQEMCL